jgi:hypothetical protein
MIAARRVESEMPGNAMAVPGTSALGSARNRWSRSGLHVPLVVRNAAE